MKKFLILALVFLGVMGCATTRPVHKVDKELAPYVELYAKALAFNGCKNKYLNLPRRTFIVFDNLIENTVEGVGSEIGVCEPGYHTFTVRVDRYHWNLASIQQRMQLVFHELGHCVLRLDHSQDSGNYMFPLEPQLTLEDFYSQVNADMQYVCTGN